MDILEIEPEVWTSCPVCGKAFERTGERGRKRIYCSRACKDKEFRRAKNASKLSKKARSAIIKQALSYGEWRHHELPAWPHYRCLACGQEISSANDFDKQSGVVGTAWYDWNDFDQFRGTYRRIICEECHAAG
jgi:predicted nucleic acid-binding Zn ribbon protein